MDAGGAERDDVLPAAVRVLTTATTAARGLGELAGLLVPVLGDWCLVDLIEPPDLLTRVVALGPDGRLELPPELGPVQARRTSARSGGLLKRLVDLPGHRLRLSAEDVRAMADSPDPRMRAQAALARSLGTCEALLLGLCSQGELFGVLTIGRTRRSFDAVDVERLTDLAGLTGTALSSLRQHELRRGVSAAVQRTLLPALPAVPGLTLAARFAPAVEGLAVGGDWYDAFSLPDGALALVVGDTTGHDVQAAARMAELRNLLRAVAVDQQEAPARTLSRLDEVADVLPPQLSGTCLYAQLLLAADPHRLRWSSAGHLPPVLLSAGTASLLETDPDLMLGVRVGTRRTDHDRDLAVGDVLVLYTDGLVEERRTHLDGRLEVLRSLVQRAGCASPEQLVDRLVDELASGDDDVAVLVVRVDGP